MYFGSYTIPRVQWWYNSKKLRLCLRTLIIKFVLYVDPKIAMQCKYTVKKVSDFPGPKKLFPARESLIIDIPAGGGKIANFFLQCRVVSQTLYSSALSVNRRND
jgi:hypothetical protein